MKQPEEENKKEEKSRKDSEGKRPAGSKKRNSYTKAEKKIISDFKMSLSDNEYQLKCLWAIQTIEAKLSMIDLELRERKDRVVISQVTHRIKSAESIYRKLQRKGLKINLKEAKRS